MGRKRCWGDGRGNRESDSLSQACSKSKVTWRSLVSLEVGKQTHEKMHLTGAGSYWLSGVQDTP